jgi:CheY-like chemotaxis protein
MPFRVREVLLVSSPYDAFVLQEDGHLTEHLFFQYTEIKLSSAPRFTQADTGEEAARILQERHFDLILAMSSLADMDINAFGSRVKELRPGLPVVLLALDRIELNQLRHTIDPKAIDGWFLWSGDNRILLAIIKYIEDRRNVDHDIAHGNVRVIIMIEDSPRFYSSFLGVLYRELVSQSGSLYSEGLSELYRRTYMKSRPKILHARSYEEGVELFWHYRNNVLAVICDVSIPRGGQLDPSAGLDFARFARRHDPYLPLLMQSAEENIREQAEEIDALFVDKSSPSLLAEIQLFLSKALGFGDFIFRTAEGEEIDRAKDLRELEAKLATIPPEVLAYHAEQNHISIWLMARSEFELAEELRPKKITDFESIEDCRQHLIRSLKESRERVHRGVISDFDPNRFEHDRFSRIGDGYMGGKARGIAFLYQTLSETNLGVSPELQVKVPQSIVITTDEFDRFLENNQLQELAFTSEDDLETSDAFLRGQLSGDLVDKLNLIVQRLNGPLAVRSSSLLEDSMHQPFAGIYLTFLIPNNYPETKSRLKEVCDAIRLVYASAFFQAAKSYLRATGNRVEEEKMAVIIQRVVGSHWNGRFYPDFSGLAQSYNYYPIGPQSPEDGIVHLAIGLGRLVVEGGLALRFSPKHPQVMPQFASPKSMLNYSQRGFWAIDMKRECCSAGYDLYSTLQFYDLKAAEEDGSLKLAGSVYCANDEQVRDDLSLPGPRVVTFNNILKHKVIPLDKTIGQVLEMGRSGLGCPVEVEFACDMGCNADQPTLFLLQVRPLASRSSTSELSDVRISREDTLCSSKGSLGHGENREIRDIVYVVNDRWEARYNKAIAKEVETLNRQHEEEGRPYILIGPGRWGTADEWLGIPVKWAQVSRAKVIVEAAPEGCAVEPSQGTHFFHNIAAHNVGYLNLPPGADKSDSERDLFLDWEWLNAQPAFAETQYLRHIRLETPLTVVLDGRKGRGIVAKPGAG